MLDFDYLRGIARYGAPLLKGRIPEDKIDGWITLHGDGEPRRVPIQYVNDARDKLTYRIHPDFHPEHSVKFDKGERVQPSAAEIHRREESLDALKQRTFTLEGDSLRKHREIAAKIEHKEPSLQEQVESAWDDTPKKSKAEANRQLKQSQGWVKTCDDILAKKPHDEETQELKRFHEAYIEHLGKVIKGFQPAAKPEKADQEALERYAEEHDKHFVSPRLVSEMEADIARKQARYDALLKAQSGGYTAEVAKHFHLGTVGGSGPNVSSLNRKREAELDRTIDRAKEIVQLDGELRTARARLDGYSKGRINEQGRQHAPTASKLKELLTQGKAMLESGKIKGAEMTPEQRSNLTELMKQYQKDYRTRVLKFKEEFQRGGVPEKRNVAVEVAEPTDAKAYHEAGLKREKELLATYPKVQGNLTARDKNAQGYLTAMEEWRKKHGDVNVIRGRVEEHEKALRQLAQGDSND